MSYSLSFQWTPQWTPEWRELDYLRYVGARDVTAREVEIFGLSHFIGDRYHTLAEDHSDDASPKVTGDPLRDRAVHGQNETR